MKTKDFFRYTARPLNIFVLVCILIFIIFFLEKIAANFFIVFTQQDTHNKQEAIESYFTVVSPSVFYGFNKIIENYPINFDLIFPNDREGLVKVYFEIITDSYPRNLLINIPLSFLMMLFTFWHGWARKNNRVCFGLWIIFVGVFGLAGLLTYLGLNHTTTIKCPACGKNRNLEQDKCIRCDAKLPGAKALIIAD
ncbi:MAG: hypothetical protein A2Y12_08345 [Planctomycetes bacterium GWF2_42_9]|nr:MAG: hypothetical protein A2Y12_08345 [Planctomycetes bacterium GWF2_42_9]HAL44419.1 hypothetical protein [Phycisphaerales bacterium]